MLCFAVFLGSWSPLATTGISLPSLSMSAGKGAVDYSTPSGENSGHVVNAGINVYIISLYSKRITCALHVGLHVEKLLMDMAIWLHEQNIHLTNFISVIIIINKE